MCFVHIILEIVGFITDEYEYCILHVESKFLILLQMFSLLPFILFLFIFRHVKLLYIFLMVSFFDSIGL